MDKKRPRWRRRGHHAKYLNGKTSRGKYRIGLFIISELTQSLEIEPIKITLLVASAVRAKLVKLRAKRRRRRMLKVDFQLLIRTGRRSSGCRQVLRPCGSGAHPCQGVPPSRPCHPLHLRRRPGKCCWGQRRGSRHRRHRPPYLVHYRTCGASSRRSILHKPRPPGGRV